MSTDPASTSSNKALVVVHETVGFVLTWRADMYCTAWLLKAGVHTVGAPFSFEKIQGDLPGSGVYVVDLELQDPPIDGPPLLWAILWTLATKAEWESFIHGVIPWP